MSIGFHWGDPPDRIMEHLEFAERRQGVRGDAVSARADEIARKRAESNVRLWATREQRGASIHEFGARFEGDPKFSVLERQDRYKALVAEDMARLEREPVRPTDLEVAAARIEVATKGTKYEETGRFPGMALEFGTVDEAADIRAERETLSSELAKPGMELETFRKVRLLERCFRSFTVSEMQGLSEGKGPLLEALPDEAARTQAAENFNALLLADVAGPAPRKKAQAGVPSDCRTWRHRQIQRREPRDWSRATLSGANLPDRPIVEIMER